MLGLASAAVGTSKAGLSKVSGQTSIESGGTLGLDANPVLVGFWRDYPSTFARKTRRAWIPGQAGNDKVPGMTGCAYFCRYTRTHSTSMVAGNWLSATVPPRVPPTATFSNRYCG